MIDGNLKGNKSRCFLVIMCMMIGFSLLNVFSSNKVNAEENEVGKVYTSSEGNSNGGNTYQLTYQFVDKDKRKVVYEESVDLKKGTQWSYTNPNKVEIGGKIYTSYNEPKKYEGELNWDYTFQIDYTQKELIPNTRYEVLEGTYDGGLRLEEVRWNKTGDGAETNISLRGLGNHGHADVDKIDVREWYGTADSYESADERIEDGDRVSFRSRKSMSANAMYRNKQSIGKGAEGSYNLEYRYYYTNVVEKNISCNDGTMDRCFDWKEKKNAKKHAYWGTGDLDQRVEVMNEDGEIVEVPVTQEYLFKVELKGEDNDDTHIIVEEDGVVDEEFVVGSEVVPDTYTGDDEPVIEEITETIKMNPNMVDDNKTQQGVNFSEEFEYNNSLGEELDYTKINGSYYTKLDKNLRDDLPLKDGKAEVGVVYDPNTEEFKFDTVFGISKKYGIQVSVGLNEYKNNPDVLQEELNKELGELGLGEDTLLNMDYKKSRYFMPIDDEEDTLRNENKDHIIIENIGMNDVTIEYHRKVKYEDYLYGNIFDSPVYAQQKEDVKRVEYTNSEIANKKDLKKLEEYLEESRGSTRRVNMFRVTDDEEINEVLNK